jgi:hypothetical protein
MLTLFSKPPDKSKNMPTLFELNTSLDGRWYYVLIGGKWLCVTNATDKPSYMITLNVGLYAVCNLGGLWGHLSRTD